MKNQWLSHGLLIVVLWCFSPGCDPATVNTGGGDPAQDDLGPKGDGGVTKDSNVPGDTMPAKPPSTKEKCGDGIDNDQDGQVDEGCGCKPGSTQKCFPWPKLYTKGECRQGTQACKGGGEFGKWGPCVGAVTPKPEICGNGKDENCDGKDNPCPPKCGDGKCNGKENCKNCPQDCGKCCGNGKCEPHYGENCQSCPQDCGKCPPKCGDGKCTGGEDCQSCPQDCGKCPTKCENFTYGITARAVDIVFIIDQSGSMSTEIAGVKNYMNQFASYINGVKIDYHVIILAYRGTGTYDICIPPPLGGANCGNNTRFKQVSQKVYSSDSLTKYKTYVSQIESFMRKNSLRQIVEISDDNSYLSASAFNSWIKARPGYSDYTFHSIVGLSSGGCVAKVGSVYIDLSNWTKGLKFHICNANWNSLFQQLGKNVAGIAITQFPLSKKPLGNKVDVWYGGTKKTQTVHYAYIPSGNWVQLKPPFPPNNTPIKVCYSYKP